MRLGAKKIFAGKKPKKRTCVFAVVLLFLACFILSLYYAFFVLRPSVISVAKSRANEIGVMTINRAVAEKLKNENIDIYDFLEFTYDTAGNITSLSSNVSYASLIKSELALSVTEAINNIKKSEIAITLGTLSGVDILYGTGPEIPLAIKPYGFATTDIKTKFHQEGINQTAFEIVAEVSADVSILMPTIKKSEKIKTTVPIVSAIIVGDVPQSYTNVDRDGYEYEDDVLQLAE